MINAFTVDLEDWYQGLTSTSTQITRWPEFEDRVVESTHRLLNLFKNANVSATFFVLGYVAEQHPALIREIAELGHEIALHGYYHYRVSTLTPEEFRKDLQRGKAAVQQACGITPRGYRAPMFSINQDNLWALEVLDQEGFIYDSSVFPTRNMLYGYPSAPRTPYRPLKDSQLLELPLSTVKILGVKLPVAGGFYLRSLPYEIFRSAVGRINREGLPAVIYIHPWDLDESQPYPNPTLRERFTHYYNLKTTERKVANLLQDFKFVRLIDIVARPELAYVRSTNGNSPKRPD